jgi:CheY-like chemotaxis protein
MNTMPIRSVLVVDDEVLVAMSVAEHCRGMGSVAYEAFGANAALSVLESHPEIDALVTDVRMPGLSGPALAAEALSRRPGLAVVFITGFATDSDRGAFGSWPVLTKPFPLEAIGPALQRAMALRPRPAV